MVITLNQDEIIVALKDYAARIINVAPGNDIVIDLKAGRGENGYTATLDIVPQQLTESHKPTTPNVLGSSSGQTDSFKSSTDTKLTASYDKQEDKVYPAEASKVINNHDTAPIREVPVEGEEVVDTASSDPEADKSQEQIEAEVDAYIESTKPTRSLFARPE